MKCSLCLRVSCVHANLEVRSDFCCDESEAAIEPLPVLRYLTTLALVIQRRVHGGDRLTGVRQYGAEPAEQLDKLVALAPLPECPPVVARCDGQLT